MVVDCAYANVWNYESKTSTLPSLKWSFAAAKVEGLSRTATVIYTHVGDRWLNNPALNLGIKLTSE